jgi:hypothetical protein
MSCQSKGNLVGERRLQFCSLERIKTSGLVNVSHEVPLLGRTVDLVYIVEDSVFTVEFKMHDWRRAISQARDHLLGADYAYICMPKRRITEGLRVELEKAGVGLAFYKEDDEWPFEIAVSAPRSRETWSVARAILVNHVERERMQHDKP